MDLFLSGNRDVALKILAELSDEDLVNVCQVNKQAKIYCEDESFWFNRISNKFPYLSPDILNKYKEKRTWAEYYVYDLRKVNPGPFQVIEAASKGRLDHLIILFNKEKVDKSTKNISLSNASGNGHIDIVKYLVEQQNVDVQANKNDAIISASKGGNLDIVKYLLEKGADIRAKKNQSLINASIYGHPDIVNFLLDKGADIHAQDDQALISAITMKHPIVAKILIERGANIHARNDEAINRAARSGNLDLVKYLVERGAVIPDVGLSYEILKHKDVARYLSEQRQKQLSGIF